MTEGVEDDVDVEVEEEDAFRQLLPVRRRRAPPLLLLLLVFRRAVALIATDDDDLVVFLLLLFIVKESKNGSEAGRYLVMLPSGMVKASTPPRTL